MPGCLDRDKGHKSDMQYAKCSSGCQFLNFTRQTHFIQHGLDIQIYGVVKHCKPPNLEQSCLWPMAIVKGTVSENVWFYPDYKELNRS